MLGMLFSSFGILLVMGVPIAFAIGISSVFAIVISGNVSLIIIPQRLLTALDSFPLLAVPLFIMAGELMNTSGITRRIMEFAKTLVGHLKGGLSHVNIVTSMLFAGVSGSATADAAGIGAVLIPSMIKEGYDEDVAISVTAASATIGPIIPPSIVMVVYSSITGLSIARLFIAGVVPGIMFGLAQMVVSYIYAVRRGYPKDVRATVPQMFTAFKKAFLPLLSPIIILLGIVGGVFTATEAGAVAVLYSIILGFVYRQLTIKKMISIVLRTALNTGNVLIIIAAASFFGWIIATEQLPMHVANFLSSVSSNPNIVFLLIIAILLFVGMFLDGLAAMIIMVPVLTPISLMFGFDPLHFAMIIILCLSIGSITPPVGVLLFVSCGVSDIPIKKVGFTIWVYVFAMTTVVLIITFIPSLILWLPNLIQG